MNELADTRAWIFDLDGTLTESVHDFDAIRAELGLPAGCPILESIDEIGSADPAREATLREQLARIERRHLQLARPRRGARRLLNRIRRRGARMGVLTRNSEVAAQQTLERVGLATFFDPRDVIGREQAQPKPHPEGIELLLAQWQMSPAEAVMVGDFLYDIRAGAAAGVTTVCLDLGSSAGWAGSADLTVSDLESLSALLTGSLI